MGIGTFNYGPLAGERLEVADTVYRLAAGLDHDDPDTVASAFTIGATADFSPIAARVGLQVPELTGRDSIVAVCSAIGRLDTSHFVSNIRVTVDDAGTATLRAVVMAQHFAPGEGPSPGRTRHCLFMERFDGVLVRDDDTWRFNRLTIGIIWSEGDAGLIADAFGQLGP